MNVYIIVEGVSEAKVYPKWINYINEKLSKANYIDEVINNNFYLISGNGYPGIFTIIDNAILDTNLNTQFDRLVIALDSEDYSLEQRYQEIEQYIQQRAPRVEVKIIIQHFCFETWALGNDRFGPRNPKNPLLKKYKNLHDVTKQDPELLPALDESNLNRAQFAYQYLKLSVRDKGHHLTYSKNKPDVLFHPKFFEALKLRLKNTQHIGSFDRFLNAFI